MKITRQYIKSADEDLFDGDFIKGGDDSIEDTLDDMADNIEDIQDTVDDIEQDDVNIEAENNIDNHYIAECDRCKGIFISAVVESDQDVTKITGTCPICQKESNQYLRWVVKSIE